ncbi:hypothetical protein ACJ5H2_17265 [Nocardioides sp. R1-1]|uniref:hypothetical protein n=1 Tax=Nocardioides sp. R1-1 TaxID=3383502 RepID=UPI0038CF9C42
MMSIEERLGVELHRLTDGVAATSDPHGDLRRGRRRRTRNRVAAGCASLVVVASATAVAALAGGEERVPVAQDPLPAPTTSPAAPPVRCVDPEGGRPGAGGAWAPVAPDLLDGYRTVLGAHLDPAGRHLAPAATNEQVGTRSEPTCGAGLARLTSYGTKLAWRLPGESGVGMVQLEVTDQPWAEAQLRLSHDSWRPHPVDLPGVRSAEVAAYDGGVAVVVHRADGLSVGIDANTLFGNDSLTPVSGVDLDVDQLLSAAADPRLTLS